MFLLTKNMEETNMDLILWRHAEAEDAAANVPDAKRRLTDRGEHQARLMARWLHEHMPKKLRILVSSAQRTQMTAHALGRPFEVERKIGIGADAADLLAAADWPNHGGAVLVVGHQHTLGRVAALLISGEEADWAVRKGGIWWLSNRTRGNETQTVLRAVIDPSFLKGRGVSPERTSHDCAGAMAAQPDATQPSVRRMTPSILAASAAP
jgi:phosphohistidine phosphatase